MGATRSANRVAARPSTRLERDKRLRHRNAEERTLLEAFAHRVRELRLAASAAELAAGSERITLAVLASRAELGKTRDHLVPAIRGSARRNRRYKRLSQRSAWSNIRACGPSGGVGEDRRFRKLVNRANDALAVRFLFAFRATPWPDAP